MRFLGALLLCVGAAAGQVPVNGAQTTSTMVEVPVPLLAPMAGTLVRTGDAVTGEDPAQADAANAAALKEDGFQKFARAQYGRTQVEALQFHDASGARAAYSLYLKGSGAGIKLDEATRDAAVVDGRTIVLAQTVVLIAEKDADRSALQAIVTALPKVGGPRSQAPLLPTFFPAKSLAPRSVRYALGPVSYTAMGGTLPADQLGWEKYAEAAIAQYKDKRGTETLTLLLYPTPQIAAEHTRSLEVALRSASTSKVRREGELVLVAQGTFSADEAQRMVENVHMRSEVSFDKPMPPEFHAEIRKTYSLLTSIAVLSGVGMLSAVLLGLFLGGGRALIRKMQGKDAATEAEFLSLHLDPQNEPVKFIEPRS